MRSREIALAASLTLAAATGSVIATSNSQSELQNLQDRNTFCAADGKGTNLAKRIPSQNCDNSLALINSGEVLTIEQIQEQNLINLANGIARRDTPSSADLYLSTKWRNPNSQRPQIQSPEAQNQVENLYNPTATPEVVSIQNTPVEVATVPTFPINSGDFLNTLDSLTPSRTSDIVTVDVFSQAIIATGGDPSTLQTDINQINSVIGQIQQGASTTVTPEIALLRGPDGLVNQAAIVFMVTSEGMIDKDGNSVGINSLVIPVARPDNSGGIAIGILNDTDGVGTSASISLIQLEGQNGAMPVKFENGKISTMFIYENGDLIEKEVQVGTVNANPSVNVRDDNGDVVARINNGQEVLLLGQPREITGHSELGQFYQIPLASGLVLNISSNPQLVSTQNLDFGPGITRADLTPVPNNQGNTVLTSNNTSETSTTIDTATLGLLGGQDFNDARLPVEHNVAIARLTLEQVSQNSNGVFETIFVFKLPNGSIRRVNAPIYTGFAWEHEDQALNTTQIQDLLTPGMSFTLFVSFPTPLEVTAKCSTQICSTIPTGRTPLTSHQLVNQLSNTSPNATINLSDYGVVTILLPSQQ